MLGNFCQEYEALIGQFEELQTETKNIIIQQETVYNSIKIEKVIDHSQRQIHLLEESMKELLESTTVLNDGQVIREIELLGLMGIAKDIDVTIDELINPEHYDRRIGIQDGKLTMLDISSCKRFSDASHLKLFKNLLILYLGNTSVSDLEPLKHLHNLEVIYINETTTRDITPLVNLRERDKRLKTVRMNNTQASDDPEQQVNIDKLRRLKVNVYVG